MRARRRHGRAFHALKTPARPDAVDRAVGGAAAEFLPQGLQSPVRRRDLPAASRMPSGATAASMLQQLGGSERACRSGVWRHAYTNLNRHWLACGRRKLRAVPSQGRMPMAPSAMRHEQCSTCTQLAGQLSARRWLADDTSEPGNTSGSVAIVRLPDEPKDWATLCGAEGCPAFVRAPAGAMSHAMKANAATLHLILDDESLEYIVWRPA